MPKQNRVLLISPNPYSKTGRGMDVLTECFAEDGWETSHLTFPRVFYTAKKTQYFETPVKELVSKKALVPYVDSFMHWFPKPIFNLMKAYQAKKAKHVDFSQYDTVVMESGKPMFLLDRIPADVKIIYRQSDSVKHVLGKNKHYIALEETVMDRAAKIIVVKQIYKDMLHPEHQKKTQVIRNGYAIPKDLDLKDPYEPGSKNAVYVGATKLDPPTLQTLCEDNPEGHIHIFGKCLTPIEEKRLAKLPNFHNHGFQPREIYLAYLKYAHAAIFPFKPWSAMKYVGFTSKYLNFMYYELPVVSYKTGFPGEFDGTFVRFADNKDEFSKLVKETFLEKTRVKTELDFEFFSHESRKKEYKEFISRL